MKSKKSIHSAIDRCAKKIERLGEKAKLFEDKTNAAYDAILSKQMVYTTKLYAQIATLQEEEDELKKLL